MKPEYIIQLRGPEHELGERYYSSRGKKVVNERSKAKVFSSRKEAEAIRLQATLYEDTSKVIVK